MLKTWFVFDIPTIIRYERDMVWVFNKFHFLFIFMNTVLHHVSNLDQYQPVLANKIHSEHDLENKSYNFIDVSDVNFLPDVSQVLLGLVAQLFVGESISLKVADVVGYEWLKWTLA